MMQSAHVDLLALNVIVHSLKAFLPMVSFISVCPHRLEKMEVVSDTDVQFWMAKAMNWGGGYVMFCSSGPKETPWLSEELLQQVLQGGCNKWYENVKILPYT